MVISKKRYRLTYELTEFCLLVMYNKPRVVQYIYILLVRGFYSKLVAFLSLNIVFVLINSEDPDEMPHYIWVFTVC